MSDQEHMKAEIKKLSMAATNLKMDLHDLAEELPTGWENIMETARRTYEAYERIDQLRRQLAELPKA